MCEHNMETDEAGEERSEKLKKMKPNKQNKLGKALCRAGAGAALIVCVRAGRREQSGGD